MFSSSKAFLRHGKKSSNGRVSLSLSFRAAYPSYHDNGKRKKELLCTKTNPNSFLFSARCGDPIKIWLLCGDKKPLREKRPFDFLDEIFVSHSSTSSHFFCFPNGVTRVVPPFCFAFLFFSSHVSCTVHPHSENG